MWRQVLTAAGTEEFGSRLEEALSAQNLTVKEFASRYDLSESTLYKITSGERINFGVTTLRAIVDGLKQEEGYSVEQNVIGLITTRAACDQAPAIIDTEETRYRVKPLPATTIEEEIIKGVNAEKDGIDGLISGPIAATTLEQVVDVPIAGLQFDADLMEQSLTDFARKLDQELV